MTEMLELYDKNLKAAIRKNASMNNYKHDWNKWKSSKFQQRENIRKNKMKIVELKIQ